MLISSRRSSLREYVLQKCNFQQKRMLKQKIETCFFIIILYLQIMKKRSNSSHSSDKSQQAPPVKREKKLITFQYANLNCFMSSSSQKQQKHTPTPNSKQTPKAQALKTELQKEKEQKKNALSQLRIPRRNRGKITSNSQQAFNNSILLLEYQNQDEHKGEQNHKSKERRQSPKSEDQDQMVRAIVNSCMRVITQDTEHSSNPISARYQPADCTQTADMTARLNGSYSASNMPMMVQMSDGYYYLVKNPPVRNKRTVSLEESKAFVIDIDKIEADGRTTIMIRNIPNKYTQEMLLEKFQQNHKKKFDFFYLPIDYNNNCNVGYAFLNFIHTKFIEDFYQQFHNQKWEKFNSTKVCQVCYARIQGTAQLEHHFEHSNVIQQKDKRYRPLIGLKSLTDNIQSLVTKQKQIPQKQEQK